MEIKFYGHQSWEASVPGAIVLFDPLLKPYFGASEQSFCAIYPYRIAPRPSSVEAIFLSHEHGDHFCVETLSELPRNIPIYTGRLMPASVDYCLKNLGFIIHKFDIEEKIQLKSGIHVTPLHCSMDTPFWERRVYQFLVEYGSNCFYLAVDGGVSRETAESLRNGQLSSPGIFAVSNNAQITTLERRSAFQNDRLSTDMDPTKNGLAALSNYAQLMNECSSALDEVHIAVCGGGFLKGGEDLAIHPLAEHWAVARHISAYSSPRFSAPIPGTTYTLSSNAVIETHVDEAFQPLTSREFIESFRPKHRVGQNGYYQLVNRGRYDGEREFINKAVSDFLDAFLLSDEGKGFYRDSLERRLPGTISLTIDDAYQESPATAATWTKDLFTGRLHLDRDPDDSATIAIRIHLDDLCALLQGEIDIWELSGSHILISHPPEMPNYAITYLYTYFGEQVSQDLAMKFVNSKLNKVKYAN